MEICKKQLEAEKLVKDIAFTDEQIKQLKAYQLFTLKPIILVINVKEDQIKDKTIADKIGKRYGLPCIQVSAELEKEISQLGESDRSAFMQEMGIAGVPA